MPDNDDPVVAANADQTMLWANNSDPNHLTDNLKVVDFRYRILFAHVGEDPDADPRFELSLDKVREYPKQTDGTYHTDVYSDFFEFEIESLYHNPALGTDPVHTDAQVQANIEELFTLRDYFQQTYNGGGFELVPSVESKGGVLVPNHGPAVVDNGDRGFTEAGTWSAVGSGFQADADSSLAGTGSNTATWDFTKADPILSSQPTSFTVPLSPGRYKIGATDTIHGGNGDDDLNGGIGSDTVFGDAGNDRIAAFDNSVDSVFGGSGSDTVTSHDSGTVNDTINADVETII